MLPDDLEHLHSFYLESNYITSIGNLEALSISSKNHNFLVRHNYLETGEESALSNFVENVKGMLCFGPLRSLAWPATETKMDCLTGMGNRQYDRSRSTGCT